MKTSSFFTRIVYVIALTVFLVPNSLSAQVPTDSIVADFREFVRLLEEIYPDPYTNYGGRPLFRKAAMEVREGLIQDKVTSVEELADRINEFVAPLQDLHTMTDPIGSLERIDYVQKNYTDPATQIKLEPINDGIIIVKALPNEHKDLIGSQLIAIENMPVKEVWDGLARYFIAENEIGRMLNLTYYAMQPKALRKVIPDVGNDTISYQLKTPKGKNMDLKLPVVAYKQYQKWLADVTQSKSSSIFPTGPLCYDFVGNDKNTMYFHIAYMTARDELDLLRARGMDCTDYLRMIYSVIGMPMPPDQDMAIAMIPSFSEEFGKMLQLMKQNNSKNLIIDLRGNPGGRSDIIEPTLFQLYGDEYLKARNSIQPKQYATLSLPLLRHNGLTLDQLNAGSGDYKLEIGDYIYIGKYPEFSEDVRNDFINGSMCSVKDKLLAQNGQPVYTPEHIYVVTDPESFSTSFIYAFKLWKMGATVVGVPCCQAPNTVFGQIPYELPRTHLRGVIQDFKSNYFPEDDPRAKQFFPDLMPTYKDYKRYNFDDNTILLNLMDIIKKKK